MVAVSTAEPSVDRRDRTERQRARPGSFLGSYYSGADLLLIAAAR
jgi:hypothetical protein